MLYTQNQTTKFTISGGTSGFIYPDHPQGEQTLALVEMDGIYPENGYSVNEVCTETFFVIAGSMTAEVDGQKYSLQVNDVLMVLPGQKYKTEGKVKILDIITPSWKKTQNKIIPN